MKLTIHCDGSCYNVDGHMGLGIAWFRDDNTEPFFTRSLNKHEKLGTSNEAEYLAIINALEWLASILGQWEEILICSDSEVVISQITGKYRVVEPRLQELHTTVNNLLNSCSQDVKFQWVPRENKRQQLVDKLSKASNQYFINKNNEGTKSGSTKSI
jgi:ribonuclease HI